MDKIRITAAEAKQRVDAGTAAVDNLLELLRRIRQERGVTILLVTHDAHVAAAADRIVHMRDGRIVDDAALAS